MKTEDFLSNTANSVSPSLTLNIGVKTREMKKNGLKVFNLASGEPDFNIFDHVKESGIQAINENFNRYTPTSGIPELKEAISKKFKQENNLDYAPEEIMVSNGAKQILYNIFASLGNKDDEFIIPSPYWVSYVEQIKMVGANAVLCNTDNFKIKAKLIEEKITSKTKAILLNYPCNPTGVSIELEELEKIAKLAVEKNIIIISDEVYEHFTYDNFKHISIASFNEDIKKLTITVNAVSKSFSMTGLRLGYCACDKKWISAMTRIQDHMSSGPCSISQKMAVTALNGDINLIHSVRDRYEKRMNLFFNELNDMDLNCVKPNGTFYIFPSIEKSGLGSMEFCDRLLAEKQVSVVPGIAFGNDKYIRISFVGEEEDLTQGLKRIKEFMMSLQK